LKVDFGPGVGLELEPLAVLRAEARDLRGQRPFAGGRHRVERVPPFRVRHGRTAEAGVGVRQGDGDAGQDAACPIRDNAGEIEARDVRSGR
jgi:hypothetical protein